MPSQTYAHKEVSRREEMDELADEDVKATSQADGSGHVTVEEVDAILDEIDSVLEVNAEEFVRAFIQKGGQAVAAFLDTVARGFAAVFPPGVLHRD